MDGEFDVIGRACRLRHYGTNPAAFIKSVRDLSRLPRLLSKFLHKSTKMVVDESSE
jgi:hypothetical protein